MNITISCSMKKQESHYLRENIFIKFYFLNTILNFVNSVSKADICRYACLRSGFLNIQAFNLLCKVKVLLHII